MGAEIKNMIIEQLRQTVDGCEGFDVRTADFHALRSCQVDRLSYWAKSYGYRAPKNANGSPARYFFQLLARHANAKGSAK